MADSLITPAEFADFAREALPFCATFGMAAEDVGDGWGTMRWTYSSAFIRPPDFVSGPVMMAIADAALYLALFTRVGIEPVALTNELKTNFLRPARGKDLLARATMLKVGRRVAYGSVDVWEDGAPDRLVAHATGSYVRPGSTGPTE